MQLDPQEIATTLEASAALLVRQLRNVPLDELRFKPTPEKWSMLEVLVHLWDEEALDFRPRLQSVLDDPSRPWPAIDPEGWAVEKRYNERDPAEALAGFEAERAASVAWLRGLVDPPWHNTYEHPEMGSLRAGDLVMAWLVHDPIHIRQVANLRVEWLARQAEPFSIRYAMP